MIKRVHEAFTARREREFMLWIARRLPLSITPDHLTALGLFGSLISFLSFLACWISPAFLWLSSFGLLLQNFGDSLDGNLARLRAIERPRYGFMVDHGSDLVTQVLFAIGFGLSPYMRLDCALLALVGYLTVSVVSFLRLHATGVLYLSYNRIGPTEVRILLFVGNAFLYFFGPSRIAAFNNKLGVADLVALGIFFVASATAYSAIWATARSLEDERSSPEPGGERI